MASVHDLAKCILESQASNAGDLLTAWKLQKLVHCCQAWSLVWDERILFPERIEAWADGPICPDPFNTHEEKLNPGKDDIQGSPGNLDGDGRETVDGVLECYGPRSGRYLSNLTHVERPWIEARGDTPTGIRSNAELSCETGHMVVCNRSRNAHQVSWRALPFRTLRDLQICLLAAGRRAARFADGGCGV